MDRNRAGVVAGALCLLVIVAAGFESQGEIAPPGDALIFHASFDGKADADYAVGDPRIYTAFSSHRDHPTAGLAGETVKVVEGEGRFGDALRFEHYDGQRAVFFQAEGNMGYQKEDFRVPSLVRQRYRKSPELAESIIKRPSDYNRRLTELEQLEKEGKAFILRPQAIINVGRMEKDVEKIKAMYYQACEETENRMRELMAWLG